MKEKEKKPILVVMAAGLGSRYGGLKQMEPITDEGEIILDFAVYDAMKAGFEKIVFIIKKEMEEVFKERVMRPMEKYLDVSYVIQDMRDIPKGFSVPEGRVKPWGTCHAVLAARDVIDAPFAVINADDYYGKDAFSKVYDFLASESGEDRPDLYCMAGYYVENTLSEQGTVTRGVCMTSQEGYLTSICETKNIGWKDEIGGSIVAPDDKSSKGDEIEIPKGTVVSMNFWGFKPSMIDKMLSGFEGFLKEAMEEDPLKAEYLLPIEVGHYLKRGEAEVRVLEARDKWYGVTYKEDRDKVRAAFTRMKAECFYPKKLWM